MSSEDIDSSEMSDELRTVAILVWHHQKMGGREAWAATLETTVEQQRRVERFRAELKRIVGERDDISLRINGGCVEAVIEDLHFLSYEFTRPYANVPTVMVALLGRCPSCGVETKSEPIASLAGLGKLLESFEPTYEHFCLSQQRNKIG